MGKVDQDTQKSVDKVGRLKTDKKLVGKADQRPFLLIVNTRPSVVNSANVCLKVPAKQTSHSNPPTLVVVVEEITTLDSNPTETH